MPPTARERWGNSPRADSLLGEPAKTRGKEFHGSSLRRSTFSTGEAAHTHAHTRVKPNEWSAGTQSTSLGARRKGHGGPPAGGGPDRTATWQPGTTPGLTRAPLRDKSPRVPRLARVADASLTNRPDDGGLRVLPVWMQGTSPAPITDGTCGGPPAPQGETHVCLTASHAGHDPGKQLTSGM
jgi:hypothetical protein